MTVINTPELVRQLDKLGFKPDGDEYRRNGLSARFESRWLTFQTQVGDEDTSISEAAGLPGLWKNVCRPNGRLRRVFDLPLATLADPDIWDDETGDARCPLEMMIDWVATTKSDKLPAGWECLPRNGVEESLSSDAFTVEIGPFARQGQLHCEEDRLAVSIPLLQRVPADLSPQRRACLDDLLTDIQNHSRLVRLVESKTSDDVRSILAEVDLSGAPGFAVPLLLRIGLDAVRHVVSQRVSVVEVLVDPAVTSTVWEIPSVQERPAERSQR